MWRVPDRCESSRVSPAMRFAPLSRALLCFTLNSFDLSWKCLNFFGDFQSLWCHYCLLQCSAIHTGWVEVQIFSVSATTYFGSYLNLISKYFSEIYKNPKVQAKIYLDQNLLKLKLKKECSRLRRCNSSLALNLAIKRQRKFQTVSDNQYTWKFNWGTIQEKYTTGAITIDWNLFI